jgi:hypothetical protein
MRELYIYEGASAEINAPWDAVPKQHGKNAGHGKDQRKGEEIPLLA